MREEDEEEVVEEKEERRKKSKKRKRRLAVPLPVELERVQDGRDFLPQVPQVDAVVS